MLDNLQSFGRSAQQAFPAADARRILRRLESPRYAGCLNMVEIEIGILVANASMGVDNFPGLVTETAGERRHADRDRVK
ncbi:hypothetical protein [Bradyrhizobium pachyrhizi]|uniref:hypothetical protein n=1 Tax=Bradyrhizobium pachyrhizi TaxID=280333 RepID=UPI000AF2DAA7|nr:hypothetical protein [Bradyrhizobium pachyrhizi]